MNARFLMIAACGLAYCTPCFGSERATTSLKPLPADQWDIKAAAHLLRRAGFGGTPNEVRKLHALGVESAVAYLVDYDEIEWELPPPPIDPVLFDVRDREALREMSQEQRNEYRRQQRQAERRTFDETRLWWIDRMVNSPRPFEEKMTLFWHGHFTSGMREVRRAVFMYEQNQFLRKNALGGFRDLLVGISKDRAMLVYLDNVRNNKRKPNENYARELMELFSLGVGNYSEKDIKEAARAFTGWRFDRQGFRFDRRQHDYGQKTFLKTRGKLTGYDVIDIIVKQPACSRFLARNLLEFYCRPKPSKQLVGKLAAVIRREKFRLEPVMRTLLLSRAFYDDAARGSLIKSPVELLIGTARQFGLPINDLNAAARAMIGMGQELMQPPNVKGWDGGRKWITTATLFNRYNVVSVMLAGSGRGQRADRRRRGAFRAQAADRKRTRNPNRNDEQAREGEEGMSGMMSMDGTMGALSRRRPSGRQPAFDPAPMIKRENLRTAGEIVDFSAGHLLAVPLPADKRAVLIDYLKGEDAAFQPDGRRGAARVRAMIQLLVSTPEYQMN